MSQISEEKIFYVRQGTILELWERSFGNRGWLLLSRRNYGKVGVVGDLHGDFKTLKSVTQGG